MGLGAGVAALIDCMQPILSAAVVGPILGERVSGRHRIGLYLGLAGGALVVARKISLILGTTEGMVWAFVGLLGITFGTIFQKKYCADMGSRSVRRSSFSSTLLVSLFALLLEDGAIHWTPRVGAWHTWPYSYRSSRWFC